jgi:hypothetical protein
MFVESLNSGVAMVSVVVGVFGRERLSLRLVKNTGCECRPGR